MSKVRTKIQRAMFKKVKLDYESFHSTYVVFRDEYVNHSCEFTKVYLLDRLKELLNDYDKHDLILSLIDVLNLMVDCDTYAITICDVLKLIEELKDEEQKNLLMGRDEDE